MIFLFYIANTTTNGTIFTTTEATGKLLEYMQLVMYVCLKLNFNNIFYIEHMTTTTDTTSTITEMTGQLVEIILSTITPEPRNEKKNGVRLDNMYMI